MSREIALMFSGGLDSTVAACRLADEHDQVHLLTFRNGHGHWGFGRVEKRVKELQERYPGRFTAHQGSTADLFRQVVVDRILQDSKEYGSGFMWCLGCKLVMHAHSIAYCLQHGVPAVADGSAADTSEMVEQSVLSLSLLTHMYQDHGLELLTPVYGMPREEKREWLREKGFRLGLRVGSRHMGIQPTCHAGELYYLSYVLFAKPVNHDEQRIAAWFAARRPEVDRWLEQFSQLRSHAIAAERNG